MVMTTHMTTTIATMSTGNVIINMKLHTSMMSTVAMSMSTASIAIIRTTTTTTMTSRALSIVPNEHLIP